MFCALSGVALGSGVAMGSLEGDIGQAAFERAIPPPDNPSRTPLRRIEDFAIENMRAIAIGASGAILFVAATVLVYEGNTPPDTPQIVGSVTPPVQSVEPVEWSVIRRPQELIALQSPFLEKIPVQYLARRSSRGEREDSLTWQPTTVGGTEARVSVVRRPMPLAPQSLFIEMTRVQAARGVAITRAGAPGALATKFGQLEVADMTFSDAGGVVQACLGFRGAGEQGAPVLSGWYCAAQGASVERPELACFLDRLSLLKSGEEHSLRKFFTEAEQRRQPCPTTRISTGRKPTWLDQDGRVPAMRSTGEITGSIGRTKQRE